MLRKHCRRSTAQDCRGTANLAGYRTPSKQMTQNATRMPMKTRRMTRDDKGQQLPVEQSLRFLYRDDAENFKPRSLGVEWSEVTVTGSAGGMKVHENVQSQFNMAQQSREVKAEKQGQAQTIILNKFHGSVKPREILLVLRSKGVLGRDWCQRRHGQELLCAVASKTSSKHRKIRPRCTTRTLFLLDLTSLIFLT